MGRLITPADFMSVPTIAVLGDSRLANGWNTPANGGADSLAESIQGWIEFLSGARVRFPSALNFGVAGDTSAQMLARVDACIAAMLAAGSNTVLILGSTNDRSNSLAIDGAGGTKENLSAIATAFRRAGIQAIWITETPRGDSTYTSTRLSGQQLAYHMEIHRWLGARPTMYPGEFAVDAWATFANFSSSTGDAIVGLTHDGLHPNGSGAIAIARACLPVINMLFPALPITPGGNADVYGANNPYGTPFSNPGFSGTGGTVSPTGFSGTLPDNYTGSNCPSGISQVCSIITSGGRKKVQLACSGTTVATGATWYALLQYQGTASTVGVAAGNKYRILWPMEWDALTNVRHISAAFITNNGNRYSLRNQNARVFPQTAESGVLSTDTLTIPSGVTVAQLSLQVVFDAAAVSAATIRASEPLVIRDL